MATPAPVAHSTGSSAVLDALDAETRAHPTERKRLVGPDVNYGRELLVALARRNGGWIGWEATNLRRVADDLAFVPLHRAGLRGGSDIQIRLLVNHALDRAIAGGAVGRDFAVLERSLGFRQALRDSVLELRMAGVSAATLRATSVAGSPANEVAAVLDAYEALLRENGLTDSAGIMQMALDHFDEEARYCLRGEMLLAPGLIERGLPARLRDRLVAAGARTLGGDVPVGIDPPAHAVTHTLVGTSPHGERCGSLLAWCACSAVPQPDDRRLDASLVTMDMVAAATPSEELREVFRRIIAERLHWDDVEIVTTDVDTYGIALDVLCQRLDIRATMLQGIPLARTRLGRALERWFAWLDSGLPADVLREALEAGELGPESDLAPTALARELRAQKIGWGRARYDAALVRLDATARNPEVSRREDHSDEEHAARLSARGRRSAELATLLRALLANVPPVPERGSDTVVHTSVGSLATATLAWLALVRLHGAPEEQTAARVRTRLTRIAEADHAITGFGAALAGLRDALSDVRAWPMLTSDRKPWSASGGMVHLTDVAHAGTTGRPRTFVVGLDADRTGGTSRQDPLLPDSLRSAIAGGVLSTAAERREEAQYRLASALATLRGRVTLSYATSGALDGREAGPSPFLLQAWRLLRHDAALSYEELRHHLAPAASAVPARDERGGRGEIAAVALLDARDVWMDALSDHALLLDGETVVRQCFPLLDAGLAAGEAARVPVLTPHTGLVERAAGALDPRRQLRGPISPSALETLSACPLSWFYRYGISLRPPDDPEYDAEAWLDAAQRGSLLHEVFEQFAVRFADRQGDVASGAAPVEMREIVDGVIERWRTDVPPPGEAVFAAECDEIHRASREFLEMERQAVEAGDDGRWSRFEYAFEPPDSVGAYPLTDGTTLHVKGRVDRIDELRDGSLRVIDYKTGRARRYHKSSKGGDFNGGRQLQPAIYAAAVAGLLGQRVGRFEYRFPTERGENDVVAYDEDELGAARPLITRLLDHVRDGTFIPTTDAGDCSYCDYQSICRTKDVGFYKLETPRVTWAKEHAESLAVYDDMRARRGAGDAS